MRMNQSALSKRNYSLDIIRIVAALAVVMIHCSSNFIKQFDPPSAEFMLGNFLDSISRIGVPLFLMISGALFLNEKKEVTIKGILTKNVKSLAIITLLWAIIYAVVFYVILPASDGKEVDMERVFLAILNGHYHMWYLYMIIGLYLITPFLKTFVRKDNKNMVLFFILISLCSQFFECIVKAACKLGYDLAFINEFMNGFYLDFFGGYITYFLVGWYIVHVGIPKKWVRFLIYALGALSLMGIMTFVYFTGDYPNAYENICIPVFLYSTSVFLLLNNIKFRLKEPVAKGVVLLSKLTFGIYLVHVLVIKFYSMGHPYTNNCVLYIAVYYSVVLGVSFLFSLILSKIPILKNLIKA